MDKHVELHPGYLVKVDGQIGRILAVHINSAVVQLSNHNATFKREAIEVLEAAPYSDIKTYKAGEFQKCEDCGKPKPIEEFSRLKGGTRRKQCKECFGNRIRNGRNKKFAPKPFEFSTTRKESELEMIEPVTHEEIKTVEEWVEKNLNKENNKPETELSNLEKMAQEYETKANYYQELATMAKEIVESCRSLDLKLKEREAIHEFG